MSIKATLSNSCYFRRIDRSQRKALIADFAGEAQASKNSAETVKRAKLYISENYSLDFFKLLLPIVNLAFVFFAVMVMTLTGKADVTFYVNAIMIGSPILLVLYVLAGAFRFIDLREYKYHNLLFLAQCLLCAVALVLYALYLVAGSLSSF